MKGFGEGWLWGSQACVRNACCTVSLAQLAGLWLHVHHGCSNEGLQLAKGVLSSVNNAHMHIWLWDLLCPCRVLCCYCFESWVPQAVMPKSRGQPVSARGWSHAVLSYSWVCFESCSPGCRCFLTRRLACLWCRLRPIDLKYMYMIGQAGVPVVPVVTKADTMTLREAEVHRNLVLEKIANPMVPGQMWQWQQT